ncbi:MAG: TIGR02206 family membrane protein [Lachnospiraceae bacterium]|nr:TIGR02206 family membrane protein [Agathobacter sp.]MDD6290607.1 TIGR02206 family membrane protein [Lachnospiraceae bacterium]
MKVSYLQYFFTYETEIPDGIGFALFGFWHLLWLAAIALISILFLYAYAKGTGKKRRIFEYLISFSMIGWIVVRAIYIALIGEDFLYELPLHLCSMAGILCAIHCVTGWKWLGQVLYAICLPGTTLALLFPNWNFYPVVHFITIEGFLFHVGIVMYVIALLYAHKIIPAMRKLWQVILFLVVVVTPVYFFDRHFGVNYMFVNQPSAGSPLEWLESFMGNPGYLAGYALLILLCIFLMDLGYVLVVKRRNRNSIS